MDFKDFLKIKMTEKNIGVNELARLSGLSGAQISRLLGGHRSLTFKSAVQLAPVFNIAPVEILELAGYKLANSPSSYKNHRKNAPIAVSEEMAPYPSHRTTEDSNLKELREAWENGGPEIRSAFKNIIKLYKINRKK